MRGRFTTRLQPLFPGYFFVALDTERGPWRAVNSTYGVTKLVSFGGFPTPVPRDLVSQLMTRCAADGRLLPLPAIEPGDTLHLKSGPFAEFVATVERIDPERRVWVMLELMGRTTRISVDIGQLGAT